MSKYIFLLTFFLLGCHAQETTTMSKAPNVVVAEQKSVNAAIPFKGKVIYVELEGGFWAVITDKGARLDGGVPKELQLDNQGISGYYQPKVGMMSFKQWGKLVSFTELKAIGKPGVKHNSM